MSTPSKLEFKYSGNKRDYPAYRRRLISAASNATHLCGSTGLIHKLLSEEEAKSMFPKAEFKDPTNPGEWTAHCEAEEAKVHNANLRDELDYLQAVQATQTILGANTNAANQAIALIPRPQKKHLSLIHI